jgi:prepilin-type processing-associated H-X9-DG protein/prepilin-type N-terminal cleavage/methylation domain-containing protein
METKTRLLTRRALTLVECLLALGLLGVLAVIGFPVLTRMRDQARAVQCSAHLRALGNALQIYLQDHQQTMPVMEAGRSDRDEAPAVLDTVLADYVETPEVFRCPADDSLHAKTGTSYFWNSTLNGQRAASLRFLLTRDQGRIPVLSDKENFHRGVGDGVNVLYADGHVEKEVRFTVGPSR